MEKLLKSIKRNPENTTLDEVINSIESGQLVEILFSASDINPSNSDNITPAPPAVIKMGKDYIVHVKRYMTQKGTENFDFMQTYNSDVPMPFRVMQGVAINETRGMIYMQLHCEPLETTHCMKCGRTLTHPVSRLYGLGPECGSHFHINPFETEEELNVALEEVKRKLRAVQWEGWIIKSAIINFEEVEKC